MNYVAGSDRAEVLLFPEALDDFIAEENPVRFIDAFVAQLEPKEARLQECGAQGHGPTSL